MSNMMKRWEAHYPGIDAMRLKEIVTVPEDLLVRAPAMLAAATVSRAGETVVDAVYPFSQAPEAFAHLKRGAVGKVVVRIER